jgi:hypothetical protein
MKIGLAVALCNFLSARTDGVHALVRSSTLPEEASSAVHRSMPTASTASHQVISEASVIQADATMPSDGADDRATAIRLRHNASCFHMKGRSDPMENQAA